MLTVYHRVKVNEKLLDAKSRQVDRNNPSSPFEKYLKGYEKTTIPAGVVVGVTYNDYNVPLIPSRPTTPGEGGQSAPIPQGPAFYGQTDIRISDSQNREITEVTDISDFRHKSGGHLPGFKNIHMDNKSDSTVKIEFETIGNKPICGEFVFRIEQTKCEC
ncbi:conserved protein of unknown function [Tenacibaculum litopenaei]|uniref:hypothetical protein n=1 Tax=Tenacibaculum litopenaei TaxID=396016 RepID=UPI00389607FD